MSTNLTQMLNHFVQTQRANVIKAGEALSKADWKAFGISCQSVSNSKVVQGLSNLFATDNKSWKSFEKMYSEKNLPLGVIFAITGGLCLSSAAGSFLIFLIGIALLLFALFLVFQPLMKKLEATLSNDISNVMSHLSSSN